MTTNNHTAITTGAAANASTINTPLGQLDAKMGNVSALTTTTTTSLVAAVDELHSEHGTLSSLTTTAKTSFVAAINEVDANADTAGTNASTALTRIGTLASLTTDEKTNLVGAINEVDSHADTAQTTANTASTNASTALTRIGTLGDLTTTDKDNLVDAINEVDGQLDDYLEGAVVSLTAAATISTEVGKMIYRISGGTNISTINPVNASWSKVIFVICNGSWDFVTGGNIDRGYVPSLGEVVVLVFDDTDNTWKYAQEDFALLNTSDQTSLINAINEVNSDVTSALTSIGTLGSLTTTATSNLVAAINEVNTLAGWNKATTVNKTAATTLTLNAGVSRYNVSGTTAISTINWSAGIPTVIYLMDSGLGQMNIFYDDGNIVGAGLTGETTHGAYAVVCLVYNSGNWQKVI